MIKTTPKPISTPTYGNVGVIHHKIKDSPKTLLYYKKSLEILIKSLPEIYLSFASTHHNIGGIYEDAGEVDLAFQNYLKADKIYRHSLSTTHPIYLKTSNISKKFRRN